MKIVKFFDRLEDKIRFRLSHRPVIYTLIGGIAIVLFWRGVWMTADMVWFLNGPVSMLISIVVLLIIGLFVSFFIGDQVIISGMKKERKIVEKTEKEIKKEEVSLLEIEEDLKILNNKIEDLQGKIKNHW